MTETEIDVCKRFQSVAEEEGWTVYPEVADWDLLCVWEQDEPRRGLGKYPQPGDQLAIEAKGRCRVQALEQCIRRLGLQLRSSGGARRKYGPDYAAIAAPTIGESFGFVARCMGIHTYEVDETFGKSHRTRHAIPISKNKRLDFKEKLWTPPVVPDIQAGASSPEPLTQWRVQALKLCAILRGRGWASTADFKRLDISKIIWRRKWIENDGREPVEYQGETRNFGKYVPDWGEDPPDQGWEEERDEIIRSNPDDVPDGLLEQIRDELDI